MSKPRNAQRSQLPTDVMSDPEQLRRTLNDILTQQDARIEALEAVKGLTELEIGFETGAAIAVGTAPFDGSLRIACPFTPTGLVLLSIRKTMPAGQPVITNTVDVKWRFTAGPGSAPGALVVDFVTGLNVSSRYVLRLGVTRA